MDYIFSRMQARARQPPKTYSKAQAIFVGKPSTLDAVPLVRAIDVLEHFALLLVDNDPDTVTKIFKFLDAEALNNFRSNIDAHGRALRDIAEQVTSFAPSWSLTPSF